MNSRFAAVARSLLIGLALAILAIWASAPAVQAQQLSCFGMAPTSGCTVNGVRNVQCVGTEGRDTIRGTSGNDVIVGLGGGETPSVAKTVTTAFVATTATTPLEAAVETT
jgi:hypothetical protein